MNWLTSLFSPSDSRSRRGQAMSSTHDAFSLPTSSPVFGAHPDGGLNTPDPESLMSPGSYTYPPQSPNAYGYIPTSTGSRSRPNSLLPMHHSPLAASLPYPPLASTWNRIQAWLRREYPELGDTLNYGILPQDLAQVELQFGFPIPSVIRESYLCVNGQEPESAAGCVDGLFFGLFLLPLEDVLEEWRFWREVDDDPSTGANQQLKAGMRSIPPGWIRKEYSQRGWLPLIADKAGNYVGVDISPDDAGQAGQVIVFGRDFDTKVVLFNGDGAHGWAKWLATFVEDLESGEGFEIGARDDSSESEDDIGYEGYFYDGTGRGQGDGDADGGAGGGIRLSGEYRGWNVLEAFADRSVKRWQEAGLVKDLEKGKAPERMSILELSAPAAEVAIPVLTSDQQGESSTAARPTPASLPTISVTKPPAPLPVDVPTPRDIVALPSPPDSTHSSFDEDLEAGRNSRSGTRRSYTRDLEQEARLVSPPATPMARQSTRSANSENTTPTTATQSAILVESSPPRAPASPPPDVDLLADSAPPLVETAETPVIVPAAGSSASGSPPVTESTESETKDAKEEEQDEPEVDPDVTIRLVGGGGSAGLAELDSTEEAEEENYAIADDTASITSATSTASKQEVPQEKQKKHKKSSSSIVSLKKLGKLGKKKGSVSSIKEATTTMDS